jgi:hypothetical protein
MMIKNKKRRRVLSLFSAVFLFQCFSGCVISSHAETNPTLPGSLSRSTQGSNYWSTSNLREWLNSDDIHVTYTNQAPSTEVLGSYAYDKEPGFLTNFSEEEKNAIAVTEHRVYLSAPDASVRDGGSYQVVSNIYYGASISFSLPGLLQNRNNYLYKKEKDKVFLLNDYQVYEYLQKRGWSLYKTLTPQARQKNSYYNETIPWFINGPTENIGNEFTHAVKDDNQAVVNEYAKNPRGIVPALHLKPNAIVQGKQAKDLQIGEEVTFGSYLGAPIQWIVINKTQDGYPLLLSKYIIDIKPYDAPGDNFSYRDSISVSFPEADVSLVASEQYQPLGNSDDVNSPIVKVLNETELEKRQNTSFTLELEVTDDKSGVDFVILPNGNRIYDQHFFYTISENKDYLFKAWDKAGNVRWFTIPVGNINPPSTVIIQSSANGWTNKDVTVNIFASNDVGFLKNEVIQPRRDSTPYAFPNFTSYTGKRFRISGSVELIRADKDVENLTANIGFHYHTRYKNSNEYNANYIWRVAKSIPLKELQEKGEISFDFEYTIPGDYYKNLVAWTQMPIPAMETAYQLRWKNLKYELLDNDDFKITKIILPDGREIYDNKYTDILTKEGVYTYKVLDNRGMITEKSITVLIDKVNPTLDISYPSSWTNQQLVLNIVASDNRSGVKEITLPNGSKTSQTNITYIVRSNGSYTFTVTDNAGNVTTKTITINNFDTTPPTKPTIIHDTDWSANPIPVTIQPGTDSQSGVNRIEYRLDGATHQDWTTYNGVFYIHNEGITQITARTVDNVGQVSAESVSYVKIDKSPPYNTSILIRP